MAKPKVRTQTRPFAAGDRISRRGGDVVWRVEEVHPDGGLTLGDDEGGTREVFPEQVGYWARAGADVEREQAALRMADEYDEVAGLDQAATWKLHGQVFGDFRYFCWCPEFAFVLKDANQVLALSFLLNVAKFHNPDPNAKVKPGASTPGEWRGPWFGCSVGRMLRMTGLSRRAQEHALARLGGGDPGDKRHAPVEGLGLIFKRVRGTGSSRRQFLINYPRLLEWMMKARLAMKAKGD